MPCRKERTGAESCQTGLVHQHEGLTRCWFSNLQFYFRTDRPRTRWPTGVGAIRREKTPPGIRNDEIRKGLTVTPPKYAAFEISQGDRRFAAVSRRGQFRDRESRIKFRRSQRRTGGSRQARQTECFGESLGDSDQLPAARQTVSRGWSTALRR